MTERFPTDNELQCAWDDFCEAQMRSKKTLDFDDGLIAGRLYGRFLRLFERASYSVVPGANVIHIKQYETGAQRRNRSA